MNGEVFEQAQEMKQLMEVALRIKQTRELLSFSVVIYPLCTLEKNKHPIPALK